MKHYSILALLLMFCIGFTACGNDDDVPENPGDVNTSSFVGKWEVVKTIDKYYTTIPEMQDYYNREDVEEGNGEYWEFTANKVTIHDPSDLLNGKPVDYSYNKKTGELTLSGIMTYKVTKLTSTSMTIVFESSDQNFGVITTTEFKKI